VIATSVIPLLAGRFPDAEIGVLCSSLNASVFESHPRIRRVHTYDHWFLARGKSRLASLADSCRGMGRSRRRVIRELRSAAYDAAVDFYPYFPNNISLLAGAGIPIRIGYISGGGGPLLTTAVPWRDSRRHVADQHRALLREWLGADAISGEWSYSLPPLSAAADLEGATLLSDAGSGPSEYMVIHPGTGNALKAWPEERWKALLGQIAAELPEVRIVFTGSGETERALIDRLRPLAPGSVSLCGRTTWETLRYVISRSRLVVGGDSVATHVAAAQAVPSVSIMAAMSNPEHWRPGGEKSIALTADQPCAPCFNSRGCPTMACVRDVAVPDVLKAIYDSLEVASR
jgi:ADP-heptose:LPS heptosyltransferase